MEMQWWRVRNVPGSLSSREVCAALSAATGHLVALHDRMFGMRKLVVLAAVRPAAPEEWKQRWGMHVEGLAGPPPQDTTPRDPCALVVHFVQHSEAERITPRRAAVALNELGVPMARVASLALIRGQPQRPQRGDEQRTAVRLVMAAPEDAAALVEPAAQLDGAFSHATDCFVHCRQHARVATEKRPSHALGPAAIRTALRAPASAASRSLPRADLVPDDVMCPPSPPAAASRQTRPLPAAVLKARAQQHPVLRALSSSESARGSGGSSSGSGVSGWTSTTTTTHSSWSAAGGAAAVPQDDHLACTLTPSGFAHSLIMTADSQRLSSTC